MKRKKKQQNNIIIIITIHLLPSRLLMEWISSVSIAAVVAATLLFFAITCQFNAFFVVAFCCCLIFNISCVCARFNSFLLHISFIAKQFQIHNFYGYTFAVFIYVKHYERNKSNRIYILKCKWNGTHIDENASYLKCQVKVKYFSN